MNRTSRCIACCLLAWLLAPAGAAPRVARSMFEQRTVDNCKPQAPIELALGAPRARFDGAIELDYSVRSSAGGELLEPRVELGAGWTLVEHAWNPPTALAGGGGRVVLRGDGRAASMELAARLALPEPEAPNGVIVHERVFAFGAPVSAVLGGVRTVRTAEQLSRDVPALVE
jgi:hypothetical protein